jgi:hypothetical protein
LTDPELREPRDLVSGFSRTEPIAPYVPVKAVETSPRGGVSYAGKGDPKVFLADQLAGPDALGMGTLISVIAELAAHKNAESPFCVAILGAPGSGKSFALARLAASAEALTSQASSAGETPFLSRVTIVRADAGHIDGEPMAAFAGALCASLNQSAPELVEEASRGMRDPHAAVAEAAERLDQAQRRLHLERDQLNEVEGRRARLFDTLLYEMPGSQVDAYARTYRPRIASRLQAFGFSGDPILSYKDLVGSLAAGQGPSGRAAMALRTLWAFKGQARLLVYAFILALIGIGLEWAIAHQALWLSPLPTTNAAWAADWFEAHMGVIATLGTAAFAAAALAVGLNLWRAFRFLQPVWRGVTLLKAELGNRRHELENAAAHQTRRVDGLAAEVERAARLHAEADRRAGGVNLQTSLKDTNPFQSTSGKSQALHFVTTLSTLIAQRVSRSDTPQRILFLLDGLDAVSPPRAFEILDALHKLMSQPAFVSVIAVDPQRLAEAGPGVQAQLEKWVQVPVRIDAARTDQAGFVTHLLGQVEGAPSAPAPLGLAADWSTLDQPFSLEESELLTQLAPLAGPSARSLKRFVNLYRLTRPLVPDHWACLAFMLALKSGGREGEMEAMARALAVAKPGIDVDVPQQYVQLSQLLSLVRNLEKVPMAEAVKEVAPIAASFSF